MLNDSLEKARLLMIQILKAQKELRNIYREYSWKGLGNTLGDYGELIACTHYGMKKASRGAKSHDAIHDNKRVQIKTVMHSKQIGIRGKKEDIDLFLILKINEEDASWTEIFFGSFEELNKLGFSFSARDNKNLTSVSKIIKSKNILLKLKE